MANGREQLTLLQPLPPPPPFACTQVLVMEWVEGERLRTAYSAAAEASALASADPLPGGAARAGPGPFFPPSSSEDDLRLVEVGVRCSLEQMLEEGFYHADPHPGNLLRTRDGKLAYLDFGMMGQVDATIRRWGLWHNRPPAQATAAP